MHIPTISLRLLLLLSPGRGNYTATLDSSSLSGFDLIRKTLLRRERKEEEKLYLIQAVRTALFLSWLLLLFGIQITSLRSLGEM